MSESWEYVLYFVSLHLLGVRKEGFGRAADVRKRTGLQSRLQGGALGSRRGPLHLCPVPI